jgi:hypothetical protein
MLDSDAPKEPNPQEIREGLEGRTIGTLGSLRSRETRFFDSKMICDLSKQGHKIGIVPVNAHSILNSSGSALETIFVYAVGEHLFVRTGDEVFCLSADQSYPNDLLQIRGGQEGVSVSPNIGGMCHFKINELTGTDLSLAKAAAPQKPQVTIWTILDRIEVRTRENIEDGRRKITAALKALGIID